MRYNWDDGTQLAQRGAPMRSHLLVTACTLALATLLVATSVSGVLSEAMLPSSTRALPSNRGL